MEENYLVFVGIWGARLDVLWKGNIAFLWVLENNFISMNTSDSDFI
jgi:hypothetical protein